MNHGIYHRTTLLALGLVVLVGTGCSKDNSPEAEADPLPIVQTKSGVEMVLIPAGSFQMGNSHGRAEEKPVHKVYVDSFLMDRYEITQAVFEKIGQKEALPNPSHFKGADLPAEQVTWRQATEFCNARSKFEGLQPCYNDAIECNFQANGYRLPTEAEWEYACRAGTDTDYSFGAEARKLSDFGWFVDNAGGKTHPVGQKRPNRWGLFDMHANVAEWCQDIYGKNYYQGSPEKNPHGPTDGNEYVLRGGSWKSTADASRSSYRLAEDPGFSDACLARDAIGFRCVRRPPPEGAK
jgi:formylglycine-generating enzyme required for sulfatase activity